MDSYIDCYGGTTSGDPEDMPLGKVKHLAYLQYAADDGLSKATLAQLFHGANGKDFRINVETSGLGNDAVCELFKDAVLKAGYNIDVTAVRQHEMPAEQGVITLNITNIKNAPK